MYLHILSVYDRRDGPLLPEEHEQYQIAKHKMLGNIKFIGKFSYCQIENAPSHKIYCLWKSFQY